MILAVDSSALALLVNPSANPPDDPATQKPVAHAKERVEHLLASLTSSDTLIIPTPVLAEALVRAGDGAPGILAALGGMARVRIRSFGERAAVETAMMTRQALQAGDKRGGSAASWQKVKFDRQIIAVARVEGADRIYADDGALVAFARLLDMDVVSTWELPLPETERDLFSAIGASPGGPAIDQLGARLPRAINLDEPEDSPDHPEHMTSEFIDSVLADLQGDGEGDERPTAATRIEVEGAGDANPKGQSTPQL